MAVEGIAIGDFNNLTQLKYEAQADAKKALPEAAKQFEAVFLQAMLKTMRMGQHFIDESSPFRGQYQEDFQNMLDGQLASNISSGRGIGLASILSRELNKMTAKSTNESEVKQPEFAAKPNGMKPAMTPLMKPQAKETHEVAKDKTSSIDEFVKSIWPYARQAASLIGLDPKILVAQAALETGWGRHIIKDASGATSNNLFNIKSKGSEGNSVKINTTEYIANTPVKMTAAFKKYSSPANSFHDYISLIQGDSRYESALANVNNPERYLSELHQAGYATDPDYASKILSIYNGDELQQALQRNGFM